MVQHYLNVVHVTLFFVLLTTAALSQAKSTEHTCIHDLLINQRKRETLGFSQDYLNTFPYSNNTSPIRIIMDTRYLDTNYDPDYTCYEVGQTIAAVDNLGNYDSSYSCTEDDIISTADYEFLTGTILPNAVATIKSAFSVMPVQGNLFLGTSSSLCGSTIAATIPENMTTSGDGVPDADLVVFVTARPVPTNSGSSSTTLAFGLYCLEDQYGRPIAGQLNFNPSGLATDAFDYQTQLLTAVHETTHVLGFSITKFGAINLPDGSVGNGVLNVSQNSGADGKQVYKLVINTPAVSKWAKEYFDCPAVEGAEIEDGGAAGTKLSHWEKRTFMNEYMTGSSVHNPVFSELTLAYFEDSGWYTVNYSAATPLLWGRGEGCTFAQSPCSSWPQSSPSGYYCTSAGDSACTFDLQGKGSCGIESTSDVPDLYEYVAGMSGPSNLADWCPYYQATTWCTDSSQNSGDLLNYGEVYSSQSRCFQSSLVKNLPIGTVTSERCYPVACISASEARVQFDGIWYDCPSGLTITIEGYGGSLQCPSTEMLCAGQGYNASWPRITNIEPSEGGIGTVFTISGSGFTNGTTVTVHSACVDVTVVSSEIITAAIPDTEWFNSPSREDNTQVDVVLADILGRSAVAPNGFTVNVKMTIAGVSMWIKANILPVIAVVVAVVIAIVVAAYCCFKSRKQEKARELEVMRAHEAEETYYRQPAMQKQSSHQSAANGMRPSGNWERAKK